MKINFNPQIKTNYQPQFQMNLVEKPSLNKYINSFHFKHQQDNLKQAVNIIKEYIQKIPGKNNIHIGALHPSKANYVKNGTFDVFFVTPKNKFKKTADIYKRENIYMQLDGANTIQGFYMNPDENPKNLASWFMNTLDYYRNQLTKNP